MLTGRIIAIVLGYVFGLFPTGPLVARSHQTDLRKSGSGGTGVTNSIRTMGWKAGVIVAIGDCFKAILVMLVVWLIYRNICPDMVRLLMLYSGLGAALGHNFPFYAKFKGGKGIACSVGIVFGFDWRMFPICTILFFLPIIPTGFMSLGSLSMISALFVQIVVFGQMGWLKIASEFLPEVYVVAAVITGLGYFMHRENLKRLANGTERKFAPGSKKKAEESK